MIRPLRYRSAQINIARSFCVNSPPTHLIRCYPGGTHVTVQPRQHSALRYTDEPYTGRIDAKIITEEGFPAEWNPLIFICGPSGFVEAGSSLLTAAGHPPFTIKTERFGPTS